MLKKAVNAIKSMELPFFGNIYNLFVEIIETSKETKTIKVKISLPKELKFLEELLIFELRTISKHYKKNIEIELEDFFFQ